MVTSCASLAAFPAGEVRRLVWAIHGRRIRAQGADVEDVVQDVWVRLLEAQRSERSRWDPARGRSLRSYVALVIQGAGHNALRGDWRGRGRFVVYSDVADATDRERSAPAERSVAGAMDEILALLDEAEEREMARRLAAGETDTQAGRAMGLSRHATWELAARVRGLLMAAREDG